MARPERLFRKFDRAHRRGPVAVALLVLLGVLMIVSSIIAQRVNRQDVAARALHTHTLQVMMSADKVEIGTLNVVRGERGYLLLRKPVLLQVYRNGSNEVYRALDDLEQITTDNPLQQRRIASLRSQIDSYIGLTRRSISAATRGDDGEAMRIERSRERAEAVKTITATLDEIRAAEATLAASRKAAAERTARTNEWLLMGVSASGVLILIFASLALVALRQAFAREAAFRAELRRLADTDELTGLANRRELLASLDRAMAAARRSQTQLAFAIIDIDHFKNVNDTHGHPAGDEVIRKVARTALATLRGCDVVGRLGGEEFAFVLPGASITSAFAVCERLRERIHGEAIALPDGQCVTVTISTGIARLTLNDTAQTLMERADQALYDAKNGGRDQVRLAA